MFCPAAERIGVIGDPEVLRYPLKPSTRFMVLASDGVFEFMNNHAVVSMVSRACHSISLLDLPPACMTYSLAELLVNCN